MSMDYVDMPIAWLLADSECPRCVPIARPLIEVGTQIAKGSTPAKGLPRMRGVVNRCVAEVGRVLGHL